MEKNRINRPTGHNAAQRQRRNDAHLSSFLQQRRGRAVQCLHARRRAAHGGGAGGTRRLSRPVSRIGRRIILGSQRRESGRGANQLIREGATLVRNSADVAEALGFKEKPEQETLPTDLTPPETKILEILRSPAHKDDLIAQTKLSAQEANIALSSLLIRGLIVERLGKVERV